MKFEVIVLSVVLSVVIGNYIINILVMSWALKTYIKPFLIKNGIKYINYKMTGFFSTGDFEEGSFTPVFFPKGNINQTKYFYVICKDQEGKDIQFTAKVYISFFSIREVELKKDRKSKSIVLY